ncbi:MAG: serine hydrolase [Hyphomicrobiaceae bacterium]|nr:serine hydrolase [Hyphomicrobiaceae bacterium]
MPWDFPVDKAGVGGVRAALPDMVRYLEGQLGTRESAITPALARMQQEVTRVSGHTMGMNWEILSAANIANGRPIVMHEGATGGYSSFVAFDRAAKCAVVLLSDTAASPSAAWARSGTCSIPRCLPARRASRRPRTPR